MYFRGDGHLPTICETVGLLRKARLRISEDSVHWTVREKRIHLWLHLRLGWQADSEWRTQTVNRNVLSHFFFFFLSHSILTDYSHQPTPVGSVHIDSGASGVTRESHAHRDRPSQHPPIRNQVRQLFVFNRGQGVCLWDFCSSKNKRNSSSQPEMWDPHMQYMSTTHQQSLCTCKFVWQLLFLIGSIVWVF